MPAASTSDNDSVFKPSASPAAMVRRHDDVAASHDSARSPRVTEDASRSIGRAVENVTATTAPSPTRTMSFGSSACGPDTTARVGVPMGSGSTPST